MWIEYDLCEFQLYRKHCVTEHGLVKMFRCLYEGCSFRASRLNLLEKHTLIHGSEKQFTCPHCHKKFAQPNGLRLHLSSCLNMQQHACSQCDKTFNKYQALRLHIEAVHNGHRKHACNTCGAGFSDIRNLKRHQRIHDNVLPYACTHCDQCFRYSNVLKRHLVSKHKGVVEKGVKGSKNTSSVLVKNYIGN